MIEARLASSDSKKTDDGAGKRSDSPNHIDFQLGTSFGAGFVPDNIVDGVIAFANGDVQPEVDLHPLSSDADMLDVAFDDNGVELYLCNHPKTKELVRAPREFALAQFWESVEAQRSYAREVLDAASKGLLPLSKFLSGIRDIDEQSNLALYATLKFDKSGRASMGWRVPGANDRKDWAVSAALLLTESAQGDLTEVGRCALPSCQRFFRIKRQGPGKPSRKYCPGTDHMEKAHALASTGRSQRKRQRDAAAKRRRVASRKK